MTLPCFVLGNLPGELWKASGAEVTALAGRFILTHKVDLLLGREGGPAEGTLCASHHLGETNLVLLY